VLVGVETGQPRPPLTPGGQYGLKPILYNKQTFLPKLPHRMGDLDPHLIHGSLVQPESSTEMAPGSVQPFLQGSLV